MKATIKKHLPKIITYAYRLIRNPKDLMALAGFIGRPKSSVTLTTRLKIGYRLLQISDCIHCPHTQAEIISFIKAILALSPEIKGDILEAGCYKGGSTAKFSIVAKIAGRKLLVFDSFEGIPSNNEHHGKDIFGNPAGFSKGDYAGDLEEVKNNIKKYGEIETCEFIKGWFSETMPNLKRPLALVYLDVDLASSTKTCLQYLYPLISLRGSLFSQDGHLPLVIDIFDDEEFWHGQVGMEKPVIEGLRKRKLIKITKD